MKRNSNSSSESVSYKLEDFLAVYWNDIIAYAGWEELENGGPGHPPHACVSHGYLVKQDEEFLSLSATRGVNGRVEYNQSISIPLGCITDIKKVELP